MADQKTLNTQQLQAVHSTDGPLLIIAGAGTGKTTVVTERIKHLILDQHVNVSQILALTFTEKAAAEMEERVDMAMPYGYSQLWISTFHAFCDRLLRNEAINIGLNPAYQLLTEAETVLFLRKNIFKFSLDYFRPLGNPHKFLEGLIWHFSRLRDEDISSSDYLTWAQTQNSDEGKDEIRKTLELAEAFKTYDELKTKEGVMDFSDLIANTLKLFRTRKNILKSYQDQFSYILVDEFQDTNFAQNQLAILLAGAKKNIAVVGDDDQAIYRWRGAAISNIIQFRKHFPEAKIITLTQNYRSTQEILNKSYTLIQHNNPDRLEAKEQVNKKLSAARDVKGKTVELLFGSRVEDEAELVVKKIIELVETKKYLYKDFAILVRANDHAQPFVRILQNYAVPYQFLGPGRLFAQEEIKDLIAYLKVLANFEDAASLYRVLTMKIFDIEARDIAALLNFAKRKNLQLFEALEKTGEENNINIKDETKEKIQHITTMIKKHLSKVPKDTAGQILYYFLQDCGIMTNMLSNKQNVIDEKKFQNIAKFFDKLKTFEAEHDQANVFSVVDWIDLSMQMGESPLASDIDWSDNNAVNILTIHSSKGLEFPVVFLVNLVNQRFPTRERREQIPISQDLIKEILPEGDYHLQEERRLCYVGMTRARDQLYLTAANFYGEGKRERKLSPFVAEALGQDYVDKVFNIQRAKSINIQPSLLDWAGEVNKQLSKNSLPASSHQPLAISLTYLSYSQIQSFNMCPLHYKLRYIYRVPTFPSAAQSFGISLHSALRDFFQKTVRGEKTTDKEIETILNNVWVDEGYASKSHEQAARQKALNVLKKYIKNEKSKAMPIAVEIPFRFFIDDKKVKPTGIQFGGRIDRVDKLINNTIEIIDYKTGSNMPDEKKLADDLQLTAYALAAVEVHDRIFNKKPHEIKLSLHYLEEEQILTTTRTIEQLTAAKIKILQKAMEIESSDFTCAGSMFCKTCEYHMLCQV